MFLILTNLEVVRQSNTDLCHLGLFRAPAELFDVSDVGWWRGRAGCVLNFFSANSLTQTCRNLYRRTLRKDKV